MQLEIITHNPENKLHPTPILFVHGAWHAAWCWENFLPYFAQHGYVSHAVSLRGHGNSDGRKKIRWHSASRGYVEDIAKIAKMLPSPPVIVGHSMGGYVVQKYLETHTAAAGVLLASIPVSGIFGFGIRYFLEHPWQFIKAHLLLNLWNLVETQDLVKDAFFSCNVPPEEVERHFARLQPESFRMELETLFFELPQPGKVKTPLLVLAAENDKVFSVPEQRATACCYGTEAEIFPNMAHDMMLEPEWQKVADRILDWLQDRGL